jgi:N-hydroxyarylamine O-acetyltransferase
MDAAAYLERIGLSGPIAPDLESLRRLQAAHVRTVPFENLSIHLAEPIRLDDEALFDKIVRRRRGGFCYELNGAFAALLTEFGFRVTLRGARVFGGGRYGPPLDHLALQVDLAEPWLVDVGFGRFSLEPLRLSTDRPQADPYGEFRIDGLDVTMNGKPQYRLDPLSYELVDFVPTCWWQQTSPDSHFTKSLACSLPTGNGRITLSGDRLIETVGADKTESTIPENELLGAYQRHFGITLDRLPTAPAAK